MLQWYPASKVDYATGDGPEGVACGGTNIWITNNGDNTVSKIDPDDGVELAQYATGGSPHGVAFDGTHIWITNTGLTSGADVVSKIDPANGTTVHHYTGDYPLGVAFDGTSIWITNKGDNTVSEMVAGC